MAGAALFVLIALAFALGWLLPPTSPMGGYGSRSVGPLENRARLDDPARGAP